jgi:putative acetyltransferase
MSGPAIRPETPADYPAVRDLLVRAFAGEAEALLVDRLRRSGDVLASLVAVADGAVVGHVLFSPLVAPLPAACLAPLAVDPARQRAGIGAALVRDGLARLAKAGLEAIFVLGDPAYYARFGFSVAAAADFVCPYSGPHLMAFGLRGALSANSGKLFYPRAFAGLG